MSEYDNLSGLFGQLNGRSMAGSSVGTFYCKPWDSSTVSGCGWRVGGGWVNGRFLAESSVETF